MLLDQGNYLKYRGKCKQLCQEAINKQPSLTLVRGYYHDAYWGKQQHWWTVLPSGEIYDPSKLQFPDQNGEYEEFNGMHVCDHCGGEVHEDDVTFVEHHVYCNGVCYYRDVM